MGILDELDELRRRHEHGELTEAEFEAARRELLGAPPAREPRPTATSEPAPASAPLGPPSGRPVTHLPYDPRGLRVLGRWVQGVLGAIAATAAVGALLGLNAWRVFADHVDGIAGAPALASAESAYFSAGLVGVLLMLVTVVLIIVWMYRYWEQVRVAQHGREPRRGRGWTVGGWFVPIVSLWIPKQLVDDFWRLSDDAAGDTWATQPVPAKLHGWWAAFLVGGTVQRMAASAEPEDVDGWHDFYAMAIAGDVLWVLAALLAGAVVGTLTVRLSDLTGSLR